MDLTPLLPEHRPIAAAANKAIIERYGLRNGHVNEAIHKNLSWRPSLLWKTKTEFIACEVAGRPLPKRIKVLFSDISATGLPIRVIVAYPSPTDLGSREYEQDVATAKMLGIGYLSVINGSNGRIEHSGIPISLYLPRPERGKFRKCLSKPIHDAYDLYINGDPKHGVQEIGQTVEAVMTELAIQAKKKGKLTTGSFVQGKHYNFAKLVDDLLKDAILERGILAKCRGFVDDRNGMSHKPKTIREAVRTTRKCRECFSLGLQILEELPEKFKAKGYAFRYK